jgi:hypothetical protein
MTRNRCFAFVTLLLALILACNLPSAATPNSSTRLMTAEAQTLTAFAFQTPLALATTPPPALTTTPPPAPPVTDMATASPTSSVVLLTVSTATNCRTGPGTAYDLLGGLEVGKTAEAVGRYTPSNYWIIQNPGGSGTCWLWGEYVTVVAGDPQRLPEMTPPPSPTPARVSIVGYVYHDNNRNGIMDAGDTPYPNFPLYLSREEFGPTIQETATNASGYYVFKVSAGQYWLGYPGGPPVCPPGSVRVQVNPGQTVRKDFSVLPCSPYDAGCTCP